MAKRRITFKLNAALIDRLNEERHREGRSQNAIVEQALAEFLNVPLANRDLPERPVELCPRCEQGVLNEGHCAGCNWRREERPGWRKNRPVRAPETENETRSKYPKRAKEAA